MKHLKTFNEMNENIELDIHGLKCDNCNWEDMSIPSEEYEKHVNAECPECGSNILTEEDYQQVLQMKQAVAMLKGMSQEEIDSMVDNATPDQIDQALDTMNDLGLKKTGENEDGTENWSTK